MEMGGTGKKNRFPSKSDQGTEQVGPWDVYEPSPFSGLSVRAADKVWIEICFQRPAVRLQLNPDHCDQRHTVDVTQSIPRPEHGIHLKHILTGMLLIW